MSLKAGGIDESGSSLRHLNSLIQNVADARPHRVQSV